MARQGKASNAAPLAGPGLATQLQARHGLALEAGRPGGPSEHHRGMGAENNEGES